MKQRTVILLVVAMLIATVVAFHDAKPPTPNSSVVASEVWMHGTPFILDT